MGQHGALLGAHAAVGAHGERVVAHGQDVAQGGQHIALDEVARRGRVHGALVRLRELEQAPAARLVQDDLAEELLVHVRGVDGCLEGALEGVLPALRLQAAVDEVGHVEEGPALAYLLDDFLGEGADGFRLEHADLTPGGGHAAATGAQLRGALHNAVAAEGIQALVGGGGHEAGEEHLVFPLALLHEGEATVLEGDELALGEALEHGVPGLHGGGVHVEAAVHHEVLCNVHPAVVVHDLLHHLLVPVGGVGLLVARHGQGLRALHELLEGILRLHLAAPAGHVRDGGAEPAVPQRIVDEQPVVEEVAENVGVARHARAQLALFEVAVHITGRQAGVRKGVADAHAGHARLVLHAAQLGDTAAVAAGGLVPPGLQAHAGEARQRERRVDGYLHHGGEGDLFAAVAGDAEDAVVANVVDGRGGEAAAHVEGGELVGVVAAGLVIRVQDGTAPECGAGVLPDLGAVVLAGVHLVVQLMVGRLCGHAERAEEERHGVVHHGGAPDEAVAHGDVLFLYTLIGVGVAVGHALPGVQPAQQHALRGDAALVVQRGVVGGVRRFRLLHAAKARHHGEAVGAAGYQGPPVRVRRQLGGVHLAGLVLAGADGELGAVLAGERAFILHLVEGHVGVEAHVVAVDGVGGVSRLPGVGSHGLLFRDAAALGRREEEDFAGLEDDFPAAAAGTLEEVAAVTAEGELEVVLCDLADHFLPAEGVVSLVGDAVVLAQPDLAVRCGEGPELVAGDAHGHVVRVPPQHHGRVRHAQVVLGVVLAVVGGLGDQGVVVDERQHDRGAGVSCGDVACVQHGAGIVERHLAAGVRALDGAAGDIRGGAAHAGVEVAGEAALQARGEGVVRGGAVRPGVVVGVHGLPGADGHGGLGALGRVVALHNRAVLAAAAGEFGSGEALLVQQQADVLLEAAGAHVGEQGVGGDGGIKEVRHAGGCGGTAQQRQFRHGEHALRAVQPVRQPQPHFLAELGAGRVPRAVQHLDGVVGFLRLLEPHLGLLVLTAHPPREAARVRVALAERGQRHHVRVDVLAGGRGVAQRALAQQAHALAGLAAAQLRRRADGAGVVRLAGGDEPAAEHAGAPLGVGGLDLAVAGCALAVDGAVPAVPRAQQVGARGVLVLPQDAGAGAHAAVRAELDLQLCNGGIQPHQGLLARLRLQHRLHGDAALRRCHGQHAHRQHGQQHHERERGDKREAALAATLLPGIRLPQFAVFYASITHGSRVHHTPPPSQAKRKENTNIHTTPKKGPSGSMPDGPW